MPTPTETVEAFLGACATSKEGMAQAFHDYFTPDSLWENVGMMTTTGPEEAIALMGQFETQLGCVTMVVDNLAIAAQGNKVLTERVDHLQAACAQAGCRAGCGLKRQQCRPEADEFRLVHHGDRLAECRSTQFHQCSGTCPATAAPRPGRR